MDVICIDEEDEPSGSPISRQQEGAPTSAIPLQSSTQLLSSPNTKVAGSRRVSTSPNPDSHSDNRISHRPPKRGLNDKKKDNIQEQRTVISHDAMMCKIWDHNLKEKGWKHHKAVGLHTFVFAVPSLAHLTKKQLLQEGTKDVHYAMDYIGLGEMIMKYGLDHNPEKAQHNPVERPIDDRFTVKQLHDFIFEDGSDDEDNSDTNDGNNGAG